MRRRWTSVEAVAVASWLVVASAAGGAEIDSWTGRYADRLDVVERLDALLAERVRAGIERAAASGEGCDTDVLYRSVKREVAGVPLLVGHAIAEWLDGEAELDARIVPFEESVYRDLGLFDGPSVHIRGLSGSIIVDGHVIGVDKLGHFFAEGWGYFEHAHLEGRGVEKAMDWGQASELGRFGYLTTGLYSQADLVANFNGMRFWMRLADAEPDPLGEEALSRPYVSCVEGRWVQERGFTILDYLDGVWDEGVNCPTIADADFARSFTEHVADMERWWSPRRYRCPIRPHECVEARERYGERSARLLSRPCLEAEEGAADFLRRLTGLD